MASRSKSDTPPHQPPSPTSSPGGDVQNNSPPLGLEGFCEPAGAVGKERPLSGEALGGTPLAASWAAQLSAASDGDKAAGLLLHAIERDISAEVKRNARQRKTVQAELSPG